MSGSISSNLTNGLTTSLANGPRLKAMADQRPSGSFRAQYEGLRRVSFDRVDLAGKTYDQRMEHLANQFVSIAFIKPMMEQMRNSPFKSEMFSGGSGGDMFQQHLDTVLSDRISQRANFPIAKAVHKYLMAKFKPTVSTGETEKKSNADSSKRSDGSEATERFQSGSVNIMG